MSDNPRQPLQASLRQEKFSLTQTLLRSVHPRCAARAQKRILHVSGHQQLIEPMASRRSHDLTEPRQPRPSLDYDAAPVEELPTPSAGQAESAVIGRAAADTYEA